MIRMASDPNVNDKMKVMCLREIGNDIEMFRFMQGKFQVPSSVLDTTHSARLTAYNLVHSSCSCGRLDMVVELLGNQGMAVNNQNKWGITPLMVAVGAEIKDWCCHFPPQPSRH